METIVKKEKKIRGLKNIYSVDNYIYAYPGLFNDLVTIKYYLPEHALARIEIRDHNNKIIRTIENNYMPSGEYFTSWDGTDVDGIPLEPGFYSVYYFINREAVLRYKILKRSFN